MKKMLLIFLGVLFCGFALNCNAQSETKKQEGNQDLFIRVVWEDVYYELQCPFYFQMTEHWNTVTGPKEWYKFVGKSDQLVSLLTGEVFSVNYYKRGTVIPMEWDETFHFNVKGDQGSHYIGSLTWVWGLGVTSVNMRCL